MPAATVDSKKRARKIFDQIEETSRETPDAFILANGVEPHLDASFWYVTGFPYGLFEGSYLLAQRDGKISLVTSPLEEPIAQLYAKGIDLFTVPESSDAKTTLGKIANGIKSIALNSPELTYKSFLDIQSVFKNSRLLDASEALPCAQLAALSIRRLGPSGA